MTYIMLSTPKVNHQRDRQFRQVAEGYIFGKNWVSQRMDASDLLGLLNQFGDDLTSVVNLANANNHAGRTCSSKTNLP